MFERITKRGTDETLEPIKDKFNDVGRFHAGIGTIALGLISIIVSFDEKRFLQVIALYILTFSMVMSTTVFMTCRQICKRTVLRETTDRTFFHCQILAFLSLFIGIAVFLFSYSLWLGGFFLAVCFFGLAAHTHFMNAIDVDSGSDKTP